MQQYAYEKVQPSQVAEALNKVFASMQGGDGAEAAEYSRSANRNLVMVLFDAELLSQAEELIDSLAMVHPSRFFVVVVDDRYQNLGVEIAARCVGLSKSEHSCSEVVRVVTPRKSINAAPSVIRANMMNGMSTELFLFDPRMTVEALSLMAPQTDLVMFDSGEFDSRPELLSKVLEITNVIVDLQWLAIAPWRDEVRHIFEWHSSIDLLPTLNEIEIVAEEKNGKTMLPSCSLLLAGWFIERLGLRFSPARNGQVTCRKQNGKELVIKLLTKESGQESRLNCLKMSFSDGSIVTSTRNNKQIDTIVNMTGQSKYTIYRQIDDESRGGRLRRYFQIGESITNYNSALRTGLRIRGSR